MLHGLKETEAVVLFVDWGQYHTLSDAVFSKCPSLKHIVIMGKAFVPLRTVGAEGHVFPATKDAAALPQIGTASTMSLDGLIELGREHPLDLKQYAPEPQDVAFIMYTSGSTGLPKGQKVLSSRIQTLYP
jgi:long-subunit acyl-CoA synthetase (AMP-forming)